MRWAERGTGTPVVFLHGLPTSPHLWRYVLPRVPDARCLAWEMVGYGSSIPEGRGRHISISRQADHLLAWLDAMQVSRAVLVGHDLGGGVAQIAAARRPDVCGGLVLTNVAAYDAWPVPVVRALRALGPVLERMPDFLVGRLFCAALRQAHDDRERGAESAALHWAPYAEHDGAAALVRQIRSLHTRDTLAVAEELPRLAVPARIVWGAADGFLDLEYAERLSRDLRAPLEVLEGAKHFTPEDHPDAIAEAVTDLLKQRAQEPLGAEVPQPSARESPEREEETPEREEETPEREEESREIGTRRTGRRPWDWERREQERLSPPGTARGQTDPLLPPRPGEKPPPRDPAPKHPAPKRLDPKSPPE